MKNTWHTHLNIDTETLLLLRDECQAMMRGRPDSAVVKRWYDEFKVSFVYNTNAIEGNPITHGDTAYIINSNSFLENYSATRNMEVIGSAKAYDYISKLPEMTADTLLNIHKRVLFFDEVNAGVFRKTPVYIGDKQMPDAESIVDVIKELYELDESDIFRRIAVFHLHFENLHPFIDGNGRAGRFLINLQLMRAGFMPINFRYNDVSRYYRCFRQFDIAYEKGVQEMYNLITKYEHEELTGLMEAIRLNATTNRRRTAAYF